MRIKKLSLALFLIPSMLETSFKIQVPAAFEKTICLFIYAAEILGEINYSYLLVPGGDSQVAQPILRDIIKPAEHILI